jgi:hypothetical protein
VRASTHVFAIDLVDEGFGHVLDEARDRASLDGVVLAASYHQAFDLFPHNPAHRVHAHEAGALYFRPQARSYDGLRIQPFVSRLASDIDPLARLVEEADRRSLVVRAWTNHLQATGQGPRHPDCVVRNAFDDPYDRWLCVANPDVRAYVRAVSADIARYPVETLLLESLCYQPFDLVFIHGRSHFTYGPTVRFFLGLCFCGHCEAAARAAGVAIEQVRTFVRDQLSTSLAGRQGVLDDTPLEPGPVGRLAGGEMAGFLAVRQSVVTSLIGETTEAVRVARGSTRVVVMDWSGGLMSYKSGEAEGRVTCERSWQDGVDPTEVALACDGLCMLGYTRDLDRLRTDAEGYRARMPAGRSLSIAMRPMPPDCQSASELAARVAAVRPAGPDWIEFYHYGLMRVENLDWIGEALRAAAAGATRT